MFKVLQGEIILNSSMFTYDTVGKLFLFWNTILKIRLDLPVQCIFELSQFTWELNQQN